MVPEGWKQTTLNALGRWKGGGTPRKDNSSFWENGIFPWVSPKDMKCGYISNSKDKITFEAIKNSATNVIASHSLLFVTRSGILRKVAPIAINTCEVTINQDIKALIVNEERADVKYIAHTLWCFNTKLLFLCSKEGTTVESIDLSALKSFPILLPPLPEQKKIARILSTWDKAIETVDKLIENSKQQKKALMQQLLTGKKRLPGFSGEWRTITLGEVITEYKTKSTKQDQYPLLTSSRDGLVRQCEYFNNSRLSSKNNVGFNVIPHKYITFRSRSDDGIFRFNQNNTGETGIVSTFYPVFKFNDESDSFFLALFQMFAKKIGTHSVGTSQTVLSMKALKGIKFVIPSKKECYIVGDILNHSERNTKKLESMQSSLVKQKQALMQQLLTGKRRVTIEE